MQHLIIKKALPTWNQVIAEHPEINSAYLYNRHLVEHHGYTDDYLIGSIGYGEKNHKFHACYKQDGDLLYVTSVYSICGSQKYFSGLRLYTDQSVECNCKRCGA